MTRNDPNRGNYPSKCLVLDLNPWKAFWAILVPFKCPRLSSWVTSGTTEKQGNVTISQRTALGWEDTFNNNWCNFFVPKNWGGLGLTWPLSYVGLSGQKIGKIYKKLFFGTQIIPCETAPSACWVFGAGSRLMQTVVDTKQATINRTGPTELVAESTPVNKFGLMTSKRWL